MLVELTGWTMDRTADLPKSQRFTFGQRLDNVTLDSLMLATRALYAPRGQKLPLLDELNLLLEQLRVLWRLVEQRRWISRQQLLFVISRIDEIGRMTGGWRHSLAQPDKKRP
ncbi:MAG: four helix bundle protein [Verrucomicrobiota bacterium]